MLAEAMNALFGVLNGHTLADLVKSPATSRKLRQLLIPITAEPG